MNRILLRVEHPRGSRVAAFTRRTAAAHLRALGLADCELSISLVNDPTIQALNRAWRRKNRPTDVLSFPLGESEGVNAPRQLGDIVVSLDTTVRQAKEREVPLREELARYLAHGLLHLVGYDHHGPGPRKKMAAWEEKLLGRPGLIPPPSPR